ncbi:restriction endonuclease subunit S [Campylobacter jejuni]|uniref:Putative type I specificity subunit HsdS n=2 Tax=Campylobacter jejuni TaxID=197 RepID=Q8G8A9_CAMJU|nr:restriction endonuclease subunit S [Campylobacter jejuni]AAN33159.1 putative type I specificity subunit HsdS [Campylobacter jejuni]AAN33167.1 putative type I specificity subunit HsdS [Campylobacter jejuni]EAJ6970716.1 restriction endonuclease subunit S [Campylobacter jejuni]EAK7890496.1 restriction endonuclease subunit S [Campylobacter jejuni]EAK7944539.1 restriction endonuclease subunit S [Campylobacter jejuni]
MSNLPQGWEVKKLGEIGEIVTGSTPSKSNLDFYGKDYPFFKPSDFEQGYFLENAGDNLSKLGFDKARQLPPKTILVVCIGSLGKVALTKVIGSCNQQINAIIPHKNIISEYIYYYCISSKFQSILFSKAPQTTLAILNKTEFSKLEIIYPKDIKEQERIVGILDFAFSKIDENIKKAKENLANIDELMQSALQKAFNPLNDNTKENYQLPQSWEWKSLGDTSNYGKTSQVKPSQLKGNDWILELEDIEKESGVLLQKVLFQDRQSKSNKIKFNKGDILFGTLRPYLKKVIIADDNGACSSEIMPFSTGNSITNHFIYYYLFANFLHDRISSLTYGARMPRLGTKDGKSLQIPLPPLQEQEQIAEHLDFVFEKAKALKELYTKELKDYEELKQSLLDKAFKGEL